MTLISWQVFIFYFPWDQEKINQKAWKSFSIENPMTYRTSLQRIMQYSFAFPAKKNLNPKICSIYNDGLCKSLSSPHLTQGQGSATPPAAWLDCTLNGSSTLCWLLRAFQRGGAGRCAEGNKCIIFRLLCFICDSFGDVAQSAEWSIYCRTM